MTGFNIWCPLCGGVVEQRGWTSEGHRKGRCAACGEAVTVTVHAHHAEGVTNPHAPFYGLVKLVDACTGTAHTLEEAR